MHQPAAAGAAGEVVLLPAGLPVDEHPEGLALVFPVLLAGDAVTQLRERVKVLLLVGPGVGVRHGGGGGAHPLGVDEGEHGVVAHFFAEREGVLKLLLRLPGEAHDDVRGQHQIRHILPGQGNLVQVLLPGVAAVHGPEHPVVAGLDGQMELVGAMGALRHGAEELFRGVLGMAGHEAEDIVPRDGVHHADEIGKVHPRAKVLSVGIHVLAQKGDVLIPGLDQFPGLPYHVLRLSGTLPAPDVGHDAVGAEVVAAVHDGEPGLDGPVPPLGDALGHGAVALLGGEDPLFAVHGPLQQLRETPELVGPEDQIHDGIGLFDLLGDVGLLHHAAADGDDLAGPGLLAVIQGAHVAEDPHLRVLPHGAGVHHDHVRLELILGKAVAHLRQVAPQLFAVGLVLLAAVGVHHGQGPLPVGCDPVEEPMADLLLPGDLFGGDLFSDIAHNPLPLYT